MDSKVESSKYYESSRRKDGMSKTKVTARKRLLYEIVVMSVTIGFAWVLLLLPIIFYHLPDEVFNKVSSLASFLLGIAS